MISEISAKKYNIIDFWEKDAASNIFFSEVVPLTWYNNETILWPPKNVNSRKAIKEYFPPEETWIMYDALLRYTFGKCKTSFVMNIYFLYFLVLYWYTLCETILFTNQVVHLVDNH